MMKKMIPASALDALTDHAIIKEAEQDNLELGHALKNITPEQLTHIFEEKKRKTIPAKALDEIIDFEICQLASLQDKTLGEALHAISDSDLEAIVSDKPKVISMEDVISVIASRRKDEAEDEVVGAAALCESNQNISDIRIPDNISDEQPQQGQPSSGTGTETKINWTLVFIIATLFIILITMIF